MHRSGTSALTGLLERLGARGPRTRMAPDDSNPLGYGESQAISDFNDRLLQAAGTRWDAWTHVAEDLGNSPTAAWLTDGSRSLIDHEFSDAPLFVVKDPRICRLVPYWLRMFAAHSIEPAAVIALRSPYEVASSLATRNGIGLEEALLMWLRHVLDAERETRYIRRSFVRYTDLLRAWQTVASTIAADLALEWPDRSEGTDLEITRFLDPRLRHHTASGIPGTVNGALNGWTTITEKTLDRLVDHLADGEALAALDEVKRDFDRVAATTGPAFDALRSALEAERASGRAALEALRAQFNRLELEHATLRDHASAVEQRANDLAAVVDETERRANGLAAVVDETQRRADRLAAVVDETDQRAKNLAHALDETRRRVDELMASASWRVTAPLRAVWGILRGGKP